MTTLISPARRAVHRTRAFCSYLHAKFDVGASSLPHPRKVNGGEDAYFIVSPTKECGGTWLGVADGVSAANDNGRYSRMLCEFAATKSHLASSPQALLQTAWSSANSTEGRSTACFAHLSTDGQLSWCNLGDGACWLLRARRACTDARYVSGATGQLRADSFTRSVSFPEKLCQHTQA